jgi:hypothetical protein
VCSSKMPQASPTMYRSIADHVQWSTMYRSCSAEARCNGLAVQVVEAAHGVGLPTTSTIMFGHVDSPASWARHLAALRSLQKRTRGITEFVPLPFVHMQAPIYSKGPNRIHLVLSPMKNRTCGSYSAALRPHAGIHLLQRSIHGSVSHFNHVAN